jgi:hypothetical protein
MHRNKANPASGKRQSHSAAGLLSAAILQLPHSTAAATSLFSATHSLQVAQDNHSPVLHLSQGYILHQPAHSNNAQHTAADMSPNPPMNLHPSVLQVLQTVD